MRNTVQGYRAESAEVGAVYKVKVEVRRGSDATVSSLSVVVVVVVIADVGR